MTKRIKPSIKIISTMTLVLVLIIAPMRVLGDVHPITEMEEKLEGISEEEKGVLEDLFVIQQKISEIEREEIKITEEIDALLMQIENLEHGIEEKQKNYDLQLDILEQVLINYQRGGPATYLEILLNADNLTTFLKSINVIKDISRNVGELLVSLEEGKKNLQEEKDSLDDKALLLKEKMIELQENLYKNQLLQQEQEDYLASLQEQRVFYQEQLSNLEVMWTDSTMLFTDIVEEITRIIGEGYFTTEDLNLNLGFTKMTGSIEEDTFNRILKENSKLSEIIFHYEQSHVVIEVPEKHLVLTGDFIVAGDNAIQYEVKEGTFFEIPLENASIEELFQKGPLLINFKTIAGDMVMIDFSLNKVESLDGRLAFEIKPEW
jgi:peptidoglycan hydrolase CwlO-like protein